MKLLAFKLRKQQADRTIHKIRDPTTNVIETSLENIQKCFENYYKALYSQTQMKNDDQIDALLSTIHLPTVTDEQTTH